VVYHASWPDEDVMVGTIGTIGEILEEAGHRASAMVIIGDAVTGAGYERSFLYDGWANRGEDGTEDEASTADENTETTPQ